MQKKLYKCNECGKEVLIRSKGMCRYCAYKAKGSPTKTYRLKQQTDKAKAKKHDKIQLMKPYWEHHLSVLAKGKDCENCDKRLQESVVSICHILPKQRHTDVMDNLDNCLYMCDFCHNKYDRIQSTSQVYLMPVFPMALKRYLTFRQDVILYSVYKEIFEEYIKENIENEK